MEQFIQQVLSDYGYLLYLVILGWTFLEGETVVLITGAMAASGYDINVWLLMLFAFLGSFAGDQTYYYIGRHYGTPLLARWPKLSKKIEWAFKLVRKHEILFILSFRFIYGVRNVSPFVIGMAGVGRLKFFVLNMIAALVWANTFAWGGYFLGQTLEEYMGESKKYVLIAIVAIAAAIALWNWLRQRQRPLPVDAVVVAEHERHHKHSHDSQEPRPE